MKPLQWEALVWLPPASAAPARAAVAAGAVVAAASASIGAGGFVRTVTLARVPRPHESALRAGGWVPCEVQTFERLGTPGWRYRARADVDAAARGTVPTVGDGSPLEISIRATSGWAEVSVRVFCNACQYRAECPVEPAALAHERGPIERLVLDAGIFALGSMVAGAKGCAHARALDLDALAAALAPPLAHARLNNPRRRRFWDALSVVLDVPADELRANVIDPAVVALPDVPGKPMQGWPFRELACDGPADAWELLAARGLIPMDWVDDPRRRFLADGGPGVPHPPTVLGAVLLASDTAGVLRAEALARELTELPRVTWTCGRTRQPLGASGPHGYVLAMQATEVEWVERLALAPSDDPQPMRDLLATGYSFRGALDDAACLFCPLPG